MSTKLNKAFLALGALPNIYQAGSDISQGKGVVKSVAGAAAEFMFYDAFFGLVGGPAGWIMLGKDLAVGAFDIAKEVGREKAKGVKQNATGFGRIGNRGYSDNPYGATMRQRSLEANGGYQGMTRSVLGSEARRRASSVTY